MSFILSFELSQEQQEPDEDISLSRKHLRRNALLLFERAAAFNFMKKGVLKNNEVHLSCCHSELIFIEKE